MEKLKCLIKLTLKQWEIHFLAWFSKSYRQRNPALLKSIDKRWMGGGRITTKSVLGSQKTIQTIFGNISHQFRNNSVFYSWPLKVNHKNMDCSDSTGLDVDDLNIVGQLFWAVNSWMVNSWIMFDKKSWRL